MAKRGKPEADLFKTNIKAGDHVLLGGNYAAMPGHWYLGTVLWIGREDMLVERYTLNGQRWRQQASLEEVRAFGTIEELVRIQEDARKGVADLVNVVDEAESALGRARDAVHAKLEELALGGLKISPINQEATDAYDAKVRATVEQYDEEEARANA